MLLDIVVDTLWALFVTVASFRSTLGISIRFHNRSFLKLIGWITPILGKSIPWCTNTPVGCYPINLDFGYISNETNLVLVIHGMFFCKKLYEEIFPTPLEEFCYITDNIYTKEQLSTIPKSMLFIWVCQNLYVEIPDII